MPLLDRTKKFIANIKNQIEFSPVSLEEALRMALKIEETMVEAFTNELMANLSSSDNNAFLQMLMEEKTHIAKIKKDDDRKRVFEIIVTFSKQDFLYVFLTKGNPELI